MSLQRRLTLYLFGLVIGGMIAYQFYGDRITNGKWLPENKIKQRLTNTLLQATPAAQEQMAKWPIDLAILRRSMDSATVDLGESRRTPDSIFYEVRTTIDGRVADMTIAILRDLDRDTTATLQRIIAVD